MKKYRVQGYISAGGHRMKLISRIVEIDNSTDSWKNAHAAVDKWLNQLDKEGYAIGSAYDIHNVEEVKQCQILNKKEK